MTSVKKPQLANSVYYTTVTRIKEMNCSRTIYFNFNLFKFGAATVLSRYGNYISFRCSLGPKLHMFSFKYLSHMSVCKLVLNELMELIASSMVPGL